MKLEIFNKRNLQSSAFRTSSKFPIINMAHKTGIFRFNRTALSQIGYKGKGGVIFGRDPGNNQKWFVALSNEGFEFRKIKNEAGQFNNRKLSALIIGDMQLGGKSTKIILGSESFRHDGSVIWPLEFTGGK
jgi:hypothetical protein